MEINDIEIIIQRKNIKNMYLRVVPPEGSVKISAPYHVSDEQIIDFIYSRMDWIIEKSAKIAEGKYLPKLKYVNGEKHPLWGKDYALQLIANNIKTAFKGRHHLSSSFQKKQDAKSSKDFGGFLSP